MTEQVMCKCSCHEDGEPWCDVCFGAFHRASPAEQTALPWKLETDREREFSADILDAQGKDVALIYGTDKSKAQFIVTACNNYEALKQGHAACVKAAYEAMPYIRNKEIFNAFCVALAAAKKLTEGL